jgi:hypothetical protein
MKVTLKRHEWDDIAGSMQAMYPLTERVMLFDSLKSMSIQYDLRNLVLIGIVERIASKADLKLHPEGMYCCVWQGCKRYSTDKCTITFTDAEVCLVASFDWGLGTQHEAFIAKARLYYQEIVKPTLDKRELWKS